MTTVLQYLVIATVIGLVLFGLALLLFGRGEQLAALPARTSPAALPERDISGSDIRDVRFALAVRGYRMSDVDWTLERLADELDRTKARLAELEPVATQTVDTETGETETGGDEEFLAETGGTEPAGTEGADDLFAGIPDHHVESDQVTPADSDDQNNTDPLPTEGVR